MKIEDIKIVKYELVDGVATMSHSFIKLLFKRIISDGLRDVFFYSNDESYNEVDFLKLFISNYAHLYVAITSEDVVALAYLTKRINNTAEIHLIVLKDYWGTISHEIANMFFKLLFNREKYQLVWGIVPTTHTYVLDTAKRFGAVHLGDIPNSIAVNGKEENVSGSYFYVSKEDFMKKEI